MPLCNCQGFCYTGVSASNPTLHLLIHPVSYSLSNPRPLSLSLGFPSHSSCPMFMYCPTSPVPCEICTCALQTGSSLCQLDLRLLPASHGTFLPHTFCPAEESLWKEKEVDARVVPNQEITAKALNCSAHIPCSLWRYHIQAILPQVALMREQGTIWSTPGCIDIEDSGD